MQKYSFLVNVLYKSHIRDPRGETIKRVLNEEKKLPVINLRIGKAIYLEVEAKNKEEAKDIVDKACKELLINPVVEDYEVHEV